CRAEFEEVKLGIKLAEQLPQFQAPDSIWPELERIWETRTGASQGTVKTAFQSRQPGRFLAIAAIILLALGIGSFVLLRKLSRPCWEVDSLDGTPRIGSVRIAGKGRLAVGQWLETDSSSRAQINVGSIGQVQVDPNTRIRLLQTQPTEHRLELAR